MLGVKYCKTSNLSVFLRKILRSSFLSSYRENRRKTQKQRKNPAGPIFRNAKFTSTLDRFGCVTFGFSISWIHDLSDSVFFLHRNYLYSHLEWSFLTLKNPVLKSVFFAFFRLLWFNIELLCSSRMLSLLIFENCNMSWSFCKKLHTIGKKWRRMNFSGLWDKKVPLSLDRIISLNPVSQKKSQILLLKALNFPIIAYLFIFSISFCHLLSSFGSRFFALCLSSSSQMSESVSDLR